MKTEWVISLPEIKIRAFHGIHDFEKENGNDFIVSVDVYPKKNFEPSSTIDSTMDYERVYKIVLEEMGIATEIMEDVLKRIGNRLLSEFEACERTVVAISKINPDAMPDCREAKVTLTLTR